jgi:hypothetical protein
VRPISSRRPQKVYPWLTPKVFPNPSEPVKRVAEFFDHYADWFAYVDEVVVTFATGNGDHILNYRGRRHWDDTFDWARYNCFGGPENNAHDHNLGWLTRVREGGERSDNPYMAGPMVIVSEAEMCYRDLAQIYTALRGEAASRGIRLKVVEYLEPGPEFCRSEWKTVRHPEAARGSADAGGNIATGLIDVCSTLNEDNRAYAAYPDGLAEGTPTAEFIAGQTAAFLRDFELDGVFLGNQFGLLGLWDPRNAPPATAERRAGVTRFFGQMRESLGEKLIYWQDSFWPPEVEDRAWAMDASNYALLDGILCSNFAVLVERTNVRPNIEGKLAISATNGGRPEVLFSVDFVDPWYWYRTYLDDRRYFTFQHEVYREIGPRCDGVSFFANDTFGQFVMPQPLGETLTVVAEANGWTKGVSEQDTR